MAFHTNTFRQSTAVRKPNRGAVMAIGRVLPDAPSRGGVPNESLTNVARDQLRHLKHADLALAVENRFERIVGINLSSLLLVL